MDQIPHTFLMIGALTHQVKSLDLMIFQPRFYIGFQSAQILVCSVNHGMATNQ